MKVLLVTGRCAYNLYQERHLQEAGVDAHIYGEWGIHLPDHTDAILSGKPDIIHLQWPEALTRHQDKDPSAVIGEIRHSMEKLKDSGAKLFWVMHNLLPHRREKIGMWREIWQIYAEHCDVACHHSQWGMKTATAAYDYGNARHVILRHGYFDQFQPCPLSQSGARRQIGLPADARVFLSVGSMRPDKHLREIIEFFGHRDPSQDVLMLAGNASWDDYGLEMIRFAEPFENVIIEDGYIEDDRIAVFAKACDAFLYMYGENHLTSGSPHMSQAFLLPQICLDVPYSREVLGKGASYVPPDGARYETLHRVLDHLTREQFQAQRQHIATHRQPWHWTHIAHQTGTAYEEALNR